jgi:hypothetical protein
MSEQEHKSKYAQKRESGAQMYGGPGNQSCCAHRISYDKIVENRRRVAMQRRHPVEPIEMEWSGDVAVPA